MHKLNLTDQFCSITKIVNFGIYRCIFEEKKYKLKDFKCFKIFYYNGSENIFTATRFVF